MSFKVTFYYQKLLGEKKEKKLLRLRNICRTKIPKRTLKRTDASEEGKRRDGGETAERRRRDSDSQPVIFSPEVSVHIGSDSDRTTRAREQAALLFSNGTAHREDACAPCLHYSMRKRQFRHL